MEKTVKSLAILTAAVIAVGFHYVNTVRIERQKRRQIKAWEQDRIAVIRQSRERIMRALEDPNITMAEAMQIWKEERAFLDIICHRDTMY